MTDPRASIFAAVKAVVPGVWNDPGRIHAMDNLLDSFGVPRVSAARTLSKEGLDLIKSFEGLSLKAYPDPGTGGKPWTVGYGHTGSDVAPGLIITEAKAVELLRKDVARFEAGVRDLAGEHGTQHMFDALVSFAFNCGLGNLKTSTLLRKHNEGDYAGAKAEFSKWNHAGGKILAGLTRRRAAEAALYGAP
jgi:lysozyme